MVVVTMATAPFFFVTIGNSHAIVIDVERCYHFAIKMPYFIQKKMTARVKFPVMLFRLEIARNTLQKFLPYCELWAINGEIRGQTLGSHLFLRKFRVPADIYTLIRDTTKTTKD